MPEENPYVPPKGQLKGRGEEMGWDNMNQRVGERYCQGGFFMVLGVLLLGTMAVPPHDLGIGLLFGGVLLAAARWSFFQGREKKAELVENGHWHPDLVKAAFRKCLVGYLWRGLVTLGLGLVIYLSMTFR